MIVNSTEGYSGSDLTALAKEAALRTMRELDDILTVPIEKVRKVDASDFKNAMKIIKPSVSFENLKSLELWNKQFGSSK